MLAGYATNWIKTDVADPHTMANYPPMENLIPLTLTLNVVGLAIIWQLEYLDGEMNINFFLLSFTIHFWIVSL